MAIAVVAGVLATVAGCAEPTQPGLPPAGADYVDGPYGQACDASGPFVESTTPTEPLPAEAVLVRATRCVFEFERVRDDGEWTVRVDQEATTGLAALADALRQPSEVAPIPAACPAIAYAPIIITVTDTDGRQFHPSIPTTACGAPLRTVTDAIVALPWTTTERTRVAQIRTELEFTSNCSGSYKAMVALVATEGDSAARRLPVDTTPRPMSVCRFAVPAEAADAAASGELHTGVLVAASTLDPAVAGELLEAIDAAPDPTTRCTKPSSFVVINEADGRQLELMVEVDGCYRVMVGSDVRQLDPDLVTRLLG
jgi:hypothetical protein